MLRYRPSTSCQLAPSISRSSVFVVSIEKAFSIGDLDADEDEGSVKPPVCICWANPQPRPRASTYRRVDAAFRPFSWRPWPRRFWGIGRREFARGADEKDDALSPVFSSYLTKNDFGVPLVTTFICIEPSSVIPLWAVHACAC